MDFEAAFVYFRDNSTNVWTLFQTLRSSDYCDFVYPEASEHSKVFVVRAKFGCSVSLHGDTVAVGAELQDYERFEAEKPNALDYRNCSEFGFYSNGAADVYGWSLNQYGNGYVWDNSSAGQFENASIVNCAVLDLHSVVIQSNGIPDHDLGAFPLSGDTVGRGEQDNPSVVKPQEYTFTLPRFPNVTVVNPVSVLDDPAQLPQGPIGIALNGVPFFNPFNEHGDDTTKEGEIDFLSSDFCNGAPVTKSYESKVPVTSSQPSVKMTETIIWSNAYAYRRDPICMYNNSQGLRSPLLGYALDGFPIYGPFDETGTMPADLDACNGRFDSELGYVYHITPNVKPYIIGCFRGRLHYEVESLDTPFPEPSPQASRRRDLTKYGKGAVYVFVLVSDVDGNSAVDLATGLGDFISNTATSAWLENEKLVAPDAEHGDRFGRVVSLSHDQLLVGAPYEKAKPRSTFDFETGDLRGWTATGDAFNFQPTFKDNTLYRNVYGDVRVSGFRNPSGDFYEGSSNREGIEFDIKKSVEGETIRVEYGERTTHVDHPIEEFYRASPTREAITEYFPADGQKSNLAGDYFIGTFELRPNSNYSAGNAQGDEPTGTLTSDPFVVYGDIISFKIGGGCNIRNIYVALHVDGVEVKRATGECTETMRVVEWDVSPYLYQSAFLKVVDASSKVWGHINVDDFRFNWRESYIWRASEFGFQKGGSGEPRAGAVYAFRRRAAGIAVRDPCAIACYPGYCEYDGTSRWGCEWEFQRKLFASDRRGNDHFGSSISFEDESGIAIIGAHRSRSVDHLNFLEALTRSMKQVPRTYLCEKTKRGADREIWLRRPFGQPLSTLSSSTERAAKNLV